MAPPSALSRYTLHKELSNKAGRRAFLATDICTQVPVVVKIIQFGNSFQWDEALSALELAREGAGYYRYLKPANSDIEVKCGLNYLEIFIPVKPYFHFFFTSPITEHVLAIHRTKGFRRGDRRKGQLDICWRSQFSPRQKIDLIAYSPGYTFSEYFDGTDSKRKKAVGIRNLSSLLTRVVQNISSPITRSQAENCGG